MVIEAFPNVTDADENGLLAVGGDLDVESLLLAYTSGIFPWPLPDGELAWFAPPRRAILWLKDIHISRSLRKDLRSTSLSVSFNQDFSGVMRSCRNSANRAGLGGTWITPAMIGAYERLFTLGFAFSVEATLNENLVGGLYGVCIGHFVAGESMFYLEPNASKIAFSKLVEHLQSQGIEWIDCQVMTPLFKHFGATEINREQFMKLLSKSLAAKSKIIF